MTIIIAATLEVRGSERRRSWIGYGALWAFGAMVNASVLSVLPPLALWAIWPLRRQLLPAGKLLAPSSLVFAAGRKPLTLPDLLLLRQFFSFYAYFLVHLLRLI